MFTTGGTGGFGKLNPAAKPFVPAFGGGGGNAFATANNKGKVKKNKKAFGQGKTGQGGSKGNAFGANFGNGRAPIILF